MLKLSVWPQYLAKGLALFVLASLIFPRNAYAYLDPGSASYIFQVVVVAVLGGLFFIKSIFRRIIRLFKKPPKEEDI